MKSILQPIIILLAVMSLVSCGSLKQTTNILDPATGKVVGQQVVKYNHGGGKGMLAATPTGLFYGFDMQTSFKDAMDFGGTALGLYSVTALGKAAEGTKRIVSGHRTKQILGQQGVVKNGQNVSGALAGKVIDNNTTLESVAAMPAKLPGVKNR